MLANGGRFEYRKVLVGGGYFLTHIVWKTTHWTRL